MQTKQELQQKEQRLQDLEVWLLTVCKKQELPVCTNCFIINSQQGYIQFIFIP